MCAETDPAPPEGFEQAGRTQLLQAVVAAQGVLISEFSESQIGRNHPFFN